MVGAKVIAIAGADDKCKWLEEDLGVDKALNYKSPTFAKDFKESVGYLDVYFDNGMSQIKRPLFFLLTCPSSWRRYIGSLSQSPQQAR
jgi:NADPH-dependent curcumin reductase CurA